MERRTQNAERRTGIADNRMLIGVVLAAAVGAAVVAILRLDLFGARDVPGEYRYQLGQVAEVDPNQVLYRELDLRIKPGFKKATAIAVDANDLLYVAGDSEIRVFDPEGRQTRAVSVGYAPRTAPTRRAGTRRRRRTRSSRRTPTGRAAGGTSAPSRSTGRS